jgi:hypothetical protein
MKSKIVRNLKAASVSVLIAIAGCVAAGQFSVLSKLGLDKQMPIYKTRPGKFSHNEHVVKQELDCDGCHTQATESDQAGMPSMGVCRNCHDTPDKVDKYLRPFAVDNKVVWTQATKISDDVKFSHQTHLEKGKLSCEDCHTGVKKSQGVSIAGFKVTMDDCTNCHAEKGVSVECLACHQAINQDWAPKSHEANWKRYHGQVARMGEQMPYENRCSLCHTDATCNRCHQDEEPASHTGQWRERGHGAMAEMDRDQCAVCHRTDFCDRCHRDTEPMSHTAGWGAPRDRHCLTCHLPLGSQGCGACHQINPGHLEAPPRPVNVTHDTASESACRTCHVLNLTHPDNGDSCRACHK